MPVTFSVPPVPDDRIRRLRAPDGRDARIHSIKLEPYSQFIFRLAPEMLSGDDNRLTVVLEDEEPDLTGVIDILNAIPRFQETPRQPEG